MDHEFLTLDISTMAFASGVSGFLMAATMLGIYYAGMPVRSMLDWFAAGLAFGIGYLLANLLLSGTWPFPYGIGSALANALVLAGHAYILVGVQRYLGMRVWTGPLLALAGLLFVCGVAIEPLHDSLHARILVFSTLKFVLTVWTGTLLWRSRRPGMRSFHRITAAVLLGFCLILAFQLTSELPAPGVGGLITREASQGLSFLGGMVFGFLLTMAFAVMMFREKQVELTGLAEKDPLTGMNNRLSLDEIVDRYMQRADGHGMDLSIVLFDLDHFKRVNDEFGHQVGDRVLSEIAERIEGVMRDEDVAFRFGGEEFLALLPGAALDQAERIAERLRQAIAGQPFEVGDCRLELTASFGVIQYRPGRETWDDCVKRVDEALYCAKRAGRNRISRNLPVTAAAP